MDLQNKLLNEASVAVISGTSFGALGEGYLSFHMRTQLKILLRPSNG